MMWIQNIPIISRSSVGPAALFLNKNSQPQESHLEGWLKHRVWAPPSGFLIPEVWGPSQESTFPTSSLVLLMLLGFLEKPSPRCPLNYPDTNLMVR